MEGTGWSAQSKVRERGQGRSGAVGEACCEAHRGSLWGLGGSRQVEEGGEANAKAQSPVGLLPKWNEPAGASSKR